MAQRGHERRAEETEGQRNSQLSAMVQHARERRLNVIEGQNHHQLQNCSLLLIYLGENVEKRGVAGDAACRQQAIMKRERRVAATDEERNHRFSTMAKSGQDRRNRRTK
ncbi:hypothetical protein AVEN_123646-1 [Araneus ventricosus]|uniref:Uncharacterized protein n=1 Tax=Araneus ventricosus TaxID=182803 RepID=A0A4Y2LH84_ARAVE|nr:hypothetical protein AVEN_123646-1 [Araneus ventricosus]